MKSHRKCPVFRPLAHVVITYFIKRIPDANIGGRTRWGERGAGEPD